MMKLFRNIAKWLRQKYRFYTAIKFKIEVACDFPSIIPEKKILIVKEGTEPETLLFKCPCGCNADIYLNLLKDTRPNWGFYINKRGKITITPSVWRKSGCKSHFFVRNGKTLWV